MNIGVEYDVFWRLTPRLLLAFVEADRLKKREREFEMYIQGRYMFDAVSIALANAFSKKGARPINWLEEPYLLVPLTKEEEESKAEEARKQAIEFFNAMIPKEKEGEPNG